MKQILTFLLVSSLFSLQAQDFYDLNTIQTIEITFAQSNWDALMDAEKQGDGNYIMAQSIMINGVEMDSVGVKYKGNSTYNANQTKNPLHIELDTYKEHEYDGYTDIKLSNVAKDPSFLREVLSYQVLNKYMDSPQSNYANVYINGNLIGLYSNSESISKKFVKNRFGSNDNTFVKCNPVDGAGPGSSDLPTLEYMGTNSTAYEASYELKSDEGWDDLIELCNVLENDPDNIEQILDVDRALWMLAYDNVLVNLDSYIGAFQQNYYLYMDDYGRFIPVVWDLNESFGRFSATGTGNLQGTTQKQQMSHLLNANDSGFPLVRQLLANPLYKRMYIAHFKTILLENFDNDEYYQTGLELQALIDASVQADNNKFFTYANFQDNLTNDVNTGGGGGGGGGATPGITNLMDGRNTYILGLADFTNTQPTISDITLSDATPLIGETVTITTAVADGSTVYLGYRSVYGAPFTRVQMLDDGANGDGAANDGVFGASIELTNSFTQYYIYAENTNAGIFSPQRAEYEYHTITATVFEPTVGDVVINEFMASNDATMADQDGEFDDWIEFYNNSAQSIDLSGYSLSDDVDDLTKWMFPEGTIIEGNGYLMVWADDDEDQEGLHTNFKLSATAEQIFLVDIDGVVKDEVSYANQTADISYGRIPNGTGNFQLMNPTFGAENAPNSNTETPTLVNELSLFPNPARDAFELQVSHPSVPNVDVVIYDLLGKTIQRHTIANHVQINTSNWQSGIYIVKVADRTLKLIIQ